MICRTSVKDAVQLLGREDTLWVVKCARKVESLENKWKRKLKEELERLHKEVANELATTGRLPKINLEDFLFHHGAEVLKEGLSEKRLPSLPSRLAKMPKPWIPKSLKDWMRAWDQYRKKGTIPPRIKHNAAEIKKKYLDGCKDVFEKYSQDFREGKEFTKAEALKDIQKAAETTYSRAKNIVETETTNYYNKARKEIYDQSDDVTHYLFMAIRDQRTSKWCTNKQTKWGRGRHGLVYKKGDSLTEKETPAIHWFCRSEYVPLTPHNPRHLILINDESLWRRNHKCTPLPKGWAA